jgi:hypothetical protein
MKKNLPSVALSAVIMLFSFTKAHPAKYKTTQAISFNDQSTFDIDGDSWNACTGEWIHLTGEIHFTVHGVINNNRITMVQHGNYQGLTGVGLTSGKHYTGSNVFNDVYSGNFTGSYTAVTITSLRLNGPGGGNNLTLVGRVKTTVNANGAVTVSRFEDDEMTCQ